MATGTYQIRCQELYIYISTLNGFKYLGNDIQGSRIYRPSTNAPIYPARGIDDGAKGSAD